MNRSRTNPESWTTSSELLVALDGRAEPTKSARLRGALRDAIRTGRLEAGRRLPSTRALAADLGVSRGLVVETYEQLVAEGYLVAEHGSGTAVAANAGGDASSRRPAPRRPNAVAIDFGPGTPDLTAFPRAAWASAVRAALGELPDASFAYGDPQGDEQLRVEMAAYLQRVRGARTEPDGLFIVTGFTQGLHLVCHAMASEGHTSLGVEDPGAYVQRGAVERAGLTLEPIPVDADGVLVDALDDTGTDAVMITPAHQYPLGGVLAPDRRSRLIEWARSDPRRLVIEDDYDAEFRYDRSPIGALHGLAPDHVVLGGSVSKSLAPGVRLGWIAAPPRLAAAMAEMQTTDYAQPSIVDQRALAVLLSSGRYDRHIRKSRAAYRTKRDLVLDTLADVPDVVVGGVAAGLHLTVSLPDGVDEAAVVHDLAGQEVALQGLSSYRLRPGPPGLVLGYAHLTPDELRSGTRIVADTIRRHL